MYKIEPNLAYGSVDVRILFYVLNVEFRIIICSYNYSTLFLPAF